MAGRYDEVLKAIIEGRKVTKAMVTGLPEDRWGSELGEFWEPGQAAGQQSEEFQAALLRQQQELGQS